MDSPIDFEVNEPSTGMPESANSDAGDDKINKKRIIFFNVIGFL